MFKRRFGRILLFAGLVNVLSGFLLGCQSKVDGDGRGAAPQADSGAPRISKKDVTADNYLSGEKFCSTYVKITGSELGRRVSVPLNYAKPEEGFISLYYWLSQPFDPGLPTYVIVDGGPGQNTHGLKGIMKNWNEVHFDQRGLGCSAPADFLTYKSNSIYSTQNTVMDLEEIRKNLGVNIWTVYGISYGTVPATVYGSKFSKVTRAVVLEGTVYSSEDDLSRVGWQAKKLNELYTSLNPGAKAGFAKLMADSKVASALYAILHSGYYQENFVFKLKKFLEKNIRSETDYDAAGIFTLAEALEKETGDFPQQPFSVDRQVFTVIYCRELGAEKLSKYWYFSQDLKRFEVGEDLEGGPQFCDSVGLKGVADRDYQAAKFPVSRPMTYFQGAHDGATPAVGALKHWRSVPKGLSQLLINKKGGHNPNLADLADAAEVDSPEIRQEAKTRTSIGDRQAKVFGSALMGESVKETDVDAVNNITEKGQEWILYRGAGKSEGFSESNFERYLSRPQRAMGAD